jgi:hypothetical protein
MKDYPSLGCYSFQGSGCVLIEVLFRNLPTGTEQNSVKRQSGHPIPRSMFEPSTFQIDVSIIAESTAPRSCFASMSRRAQLCQSARIAPLV